MENLVEEGVGEAGEGIVRVDQLHGDIPFQEISLVDLDQLLVGCGFVCREPNRVINIKPEEEPLLNNRTQRKKYLYKKTLFPG